MAGMAMALVAMAEAATAQAGQSAWSTQASTIGELLDNPAAKAVLARHLPEIAGSRQAAIARALTLRQLQAFSPDEITDALLARIDADLRQLP